jgi:tetratricopeptide (TPR) repeat protein
MQLRPRRPLLLPLAALLAAGCGSTGSGDDVVHLVRAERFEEALKLASERAERDPDDPQAQALERDAAVALLIERGRNAVFERRYEDALDELNRALAIAPDNRAVQRWIMKARAELTDVWLDRGLSFLQAEEFERSIQAYELAEYYTPRHPEALFGATRVLFLINYRQGLGEDYYNQGVRAVHEHYLSQARHKFMAADKYITADAPEAGDRRERVESALAEERLFLAKGLERDGNFGAALIEYRVILKLESDNAEAQSGLERMSHEVEAERMLNVADKLIRQGRFEEAREEIDAAGGLTTLQADRVSRMLADIEVERWAQLYHRALNEERDFRYETAIGTYTELLAAAEEYSDAAQRVRTLKDYVERAGSLYGRLESAATPAEELDLLRQIELFWPEYRDVQERIAELESGSVE